MKTTRHKLTVIIVIVLMLLTGCKIKKTPHNGLGTPFPTLEPSVVEGL